MPRFGAATPWRGGVVRAVSRLRWKKRCAAWRTVKQIGDPMQIPLRLAALSVCLTLVSSATVLLIGGRAAAGAPSRQVADVDWSAIQDALGRPGTMMGGDVFRIGMPRTDLKVTVNGVPVQAGFALGSYAAFKQLADGAMVMGDLVLLDEEVNPVMSGLFDNGFEASGLHNHLNTMSNS